MKALSIRQPWAWLIVKSYKDVENRTWPLPKTFEVPQRIYLHAGLKQDYDAYEGDPVYRRLDSYIRERISLDASWDWETGGPPALGFIIGEVTIDGVIGPSQTIGSNFSDWIDSPWYQGAPMYRFHLVDAMAYDDIEIIPCKGRLGFWTPPELSS